MLRDARTTASVKLRRGMVTQSQGRQWAGRDAQEGSAESRLSLRAFDHKLVEARTVIERCGFFRLLFRP
ncbi:hypothetical protein DU478_16595 [Thalassococcus profundi]|uniref:Uncharacterized protein n=1 Tax=Thalassococcus profundi TaxID=2282382 RepID=A0A369TKX2_9RHOB|nr:hypothetical protein DU478_16595 [Thalassococcus profundi]